MLVHVGLLCTSNQWLGTVLPQDFALGKVGSEHKMMNIVTAVPSAWYFSFAVIMSEINPTSTDYMSACLFPDEGFWIAVCELVESKTVWYYIRSWNQRAYICRRQQHKFEIAEYNNNMDSIRLSMTHSNLKTLTKLFLHMSWRTDAFFVQKIYAKGILKIQFLALVFSLLLWFSQNLKEVQTLWSWAQWLWTWTGFWIHLYAFSQQDIFNSRYFSSANFNWNLWQNKGV